MSKKQFKIGEYAIGGIITAEVFKDGSVELRALDYATKELVDMVVDERLPAIEFALLDWTSFYYAEAIMDWITGAQLQLKTEAAR